jgi:hypothetical protein
MSIILHAGMSIKYNPYTGRLGTFFFTRKILSHSRGILDCLIDTLVWIFDLGCIQGAMTCTNIQIIILALGYTISTVVRIIILFDKTNVNVASLGNRQIFAGNK